MKYSNDWDLGTIPEKKLKREYMARIAKKPRPGRRVLHVCRHCGRTDGFRVIVAHEPVCAKNPRVMRLKLAMAAEEKKR